MTSKQINVRITREACGRLAQECKARSRVSAFDVPYGQVLTDLIMAHLAPTPEENTRKPARKATRRDANGAPTSAS